jgi:MFS family permease
VLIASGIVLLALHPATGISPYAWLSGAAFLVGVGNGITNPPSRNAGLQLAPQESATLAALRSMGRQTGSITTVSIATAILATTTHPGATQACYYLATAALFLAALPLLTRVPEHHGRW